MTLGAKGCRLLRIVGKTFCGYVLVVLLGLVFIAPVVGYAHKSELASLNGAFMLFALLLGVIFVSSHFDARFLRCAFVQLIERHWLLVSSGICVILFVVEIVISHGAWFQAGWDVAHVTGVENFPGDSFYFSICSNNLFLAGVFALVDGAVSAVGGGSLYWRLIIISCICVSLSVWMVAQLAYDFGGMELGVLFLAIAIPLIGLSPWVMVPYSDTLGMLFVSATVFSWCRLQGLKRWFLCAFIGVLGYSVKPTVLFALASCIAVSLIVESKSEFGVFAKRILIFTGGAVLALCVVVCIKAVPDIDIDESMQMEPLHFLMMGFNLKDGGSYSESDWLYSESFSDPHDRLKGQLDLWSHRVEEAGPGGIAKLFIKKSFSNFGSGDFSWGCEGGFFRTIHGESGSLKAFYGIPQSTGEAGNSSACPWSGFVQVIWFFTLIGVAILLIGVQKVPVRFLAILAMLAALCAFLLLFECRARYLILYAPMFALVGSVGWLGAKSCINGFLSGKEARPASNTSEC